MEVGEAMAGSNRYTDPGDNCYRVAPCFTALHRAVHRTQAWNKWSRM